jgi:hypothetical protein
MTSTFPERLPSNKAARRRVHKLYKDIWELCTQKFVWEVARAVQVDTGMSKAQILPLARAVKLYTKIRREIVADRKKTGSKGFARKKYQGDNYTGFKSIKAGEFLGKDSFTYDVGTPDKPNFFLRFEVEVYQYLLNERGVPQSVAWKSIAKGREAFLDCFKKHLRDVRELIIREYLHGFGR